MLVKINNPYFEKCYKVVEDKGDIAYALNNIDIRRQRFLYLHDYETGDPITISPACCASIEFKSENEDKEWQKENVKIQSSM